MKIKIFAVCLAVMAIMSCMCVTAFAEDIYVQNGVTYTLGSEKVVLAVEYGVTYTITADTSYLPTTHNWTYASGYRELRFVDGVCELTCTDEKLTSIELKSPSDTPVEITVTWPQPPEPTVMETILTSVPSVGVSILSIVAVIIALVSSQSIAMLPVYMGLIMVGVFLAVSLIRNR